MKITANRKEDLMRARDELQKKKKARDERHARQYDNFREAQRDIFDGIEYIINSKLRTFNLLDFVVSANDRYGEDIEVSVRCNEGSWNDDKTALRWNFNARLTRDGEIKKETGSWSGLQAVTSEQLESLKQTYEALLYLNNINWDEMLNVELPKYQDYVTIDREDLNPDNIDYDYEIFVEELKEHINDGYAFAGRARDDYDWRSYSRRGWYFITDVKPKTVKFKFVSENFSNLSEEDRQYRYNNTWEEGMRISTLYSLLDDNSEPVKLV